MTELNPYEPTLRCEGPEDRDKSRSVLMVLLASGLGVASVCIGLLIAAEAFGISQRQGFGVEIAKAYFVASGFAVLGVCWASASRLYWMRRNPVATIVTVGTLALAVLFVLLLALGVVP